MENKSKILGDLIGGIINTLTTWKVWYPVGVVMLVLHITKMQAFPLWALILPFFSPIIGILIAIVIDIVVVVIGLIVAGILYLFDK